MNITVNPSIANGIVTAPPSKSMAHRALICGAFSEESIIRNVAFSKDITATLDCLKALGAKVEISDDTVIIGGLEVSKIPDNISILCDESGSTLRFLLPICMASGKTVTLNGTPRLFERPLSVYETISQNNGILFKKSSDNVKVCGCLSQREFEIAGDISSQFITGLMFLLPLVSGESKITVSGNFESKSYIDLTLKALKDFGIKVNAQNNVFTIDGNQRFKNMDYTVEGDCSNAAFLEAFNYLGGNVGVKGLKFDTLQGDRVYKQIFEGLKNGQKSFDLSDCPDLAPVCFALSGVLGKAKFTGTKRLRIKESDRAAAMQSELRKFGIEVSVEENSVTVENDGIIKPNEILCGHNDHRIVMALALLCSITGGTISGADAVDKSYPDFFEKISSIGIDANETD